jgi:hypothetical protein
MKHVCIHACNLYETDREIQGDEEDAASLSREHFMKPVLIYLDLT